MIKDCETAKKEVLTAAKTLQRYPKDPIVRGNYHKLKRDYKRLVKNKEHSFRETMLQRISQLESNDPKPFCEMVKKLKTHRDENLTDNIDSLEWQEWFKKLNKPQSTHCGYDKTIDSILKRAKDFTNSTDILDKGISNIEIINASKRLKNGKAVGGDAICNEMIKCFVHNRFIDIIRAIFNAICSKSYFPKLRNVGYIIPIFKSDDSFDPSNYRGITVSSCLGKLFTLMINERLIEFLDVRNILSHYQIGFRRGYRTADHVFIINTILNSYFSKGKKSICLFRRLLKSI